MRKDSEPKTNVPLLIDVALKVQGETGMDFNKSLTAAEQLLCGNLVYFDQDHSLTVNPLDRSSDPDED